VVVLGDLCLDVPILSTRWALLSLGNRRIGSSVHFTCVLCMFPSYCGLVFLKSNTCKYMWNEIIINKIC
jgi:hypothetical protein